MSKTIEVGSDFSGIGAFDESLKQLGFDFVTSFACDMDKYARKTFIENNGTPSDKVIVNSKHHDDLCNKMIRFVNGKLKDGPEWSESDFLVQVEELANSFSFYYPLNVNHRKIPKSPLDIYMTSPPCQGFSMAGKRGGSNLFMNSLNFIRVNKPRYFVFENVKGLLSHDKKDKTSEFGRTFNLWLNYLGGKSVNGVPVVFPYNDSVPYHIYHRVLNAKDYNVPQNRERVFIIGIRNDTDNVFSFTPGTPLQVKLKDVLEPVVDNKYYLSEEMIKGFIKSSEKHEEKGTGFKWNPKDLDKDNVANCLRANASLNKTDNSIKVGYINQDTQSAKVFSDEYTSPTIAAGSKGYANGYVLVNSATESGYELAKVGDSVNFQNKNSKTRRGRVGKEISQTIQTDCTIGVVESVLKIGAIRGREDSNNKITQRLELNESGTSNALTTVQKDNVVIESGNILHYKIRRLTPRECFRLMFFPDSFKLPCSDTQLYKQAGNSIVVAVLKSFLKKFTLN